MAQVPYTPYSTAEPTSGSERISVSTPPAAFGENIGAALSQLGSTTDQVGNELFTRAMALQDLKNENDARDAQSDYAEKASLLHAQYGAKTGKDAADSLQGYIKSQNDLRTSIRGTLNTAYAQRYYDRDTLPFMQRNIFSAAGHASDQNKQYTIGTMEAQMDMLKKNTSDNPDDPKVFQQNQQKLADTTAQWAELKFGVGSDDPIVKDQVMRATSSHVASQVLGLSRTNPIKAMDLANAHKADGSIDEDDYLKIQGAVEGRGVSVAASQIVDDYFGKHMKPDGTLDVGAVQGEKDVRALAKNAGISPILPDQAASHFAGRLYQIQIGAQRDQVNAGRQLDDIILKNNITDAQQLLAVDGVDKLIPQTGMKIQSDVQNHINAVQKQAHLITDENQFKIAKGMASSGNSDDREKFMNTDFSTWHLNSTQRIELDNLKQKYLKDPTGDPRVQRAMGYILGARGAELNALGVASKTGTNADDYYKFRGALQEGLEVWQQDHNRPPTPKEITDEIAPTIIKGQVLGAHWWNSDHPKFQDFNRASFEEIPDNYVEAIRAKATAGGGAFPSDLQIVQKYNAETFNKLYGGSSGGTGPSTPQSK